MNICCKQNKQNIHIVCAQQSENDNKYIRILFIKKLQWRVCVSFLRCIVWPNRTDTLPTRIMQMSKQQQHQDGVEYASLSRGSMRNDLQQLLVRCDATCTAGTRAPEHACPCARPAL